MPRTLPRLPRNVYRDRSSGRYEPVEKVPEDLRWKPARGPANANVTVLYSTPGSFYKLIRDRNTGDVVYFKLKDEPAPASPKESIDAEPRPEKQIRYRKGAQCWFVDTGNRWYLCEVVERDDAKSITLKSVTGWDADKLAPWEYGELLQFPARPNNPLFQRLRPLKARYR